MDIPFIYGRLAEKESFIDRVEDRSDHSAKMIPPVALK